MYDTKLVTAAQHGDEAAFAALFDRNVDGVYDLCFALVGEEGEATRLTVLVFVLAARHLVDISDASQVRPWLLAITRDRVLAEDEAGTLQSAWGADSGAEPSGGKPSGPEAEVEPLGTNELRRWVREAGATLALADQLVVELGTRYDLDPDQLIAAIGCRPDRLDSIVAQVEQEAEQVLGSLILARQGRKDCKRLAGLLAGWDGRPSVEVADVADRHAATW
jgi:DNA-directed RNA polymerase specialized sigma24 family protein